MSIIVSNSASATRSAPSHLEPDRLDVTLRQLLDHVAVELAHEYIRLMETAAEASEDDESCDPWEDR
jgi:hypothetical protein